MIRGIGMDLVSISFVEQMLAKCGELFIQQYYSMEERELFACKKTCGTVPGRQIRRQRSAAEGLRHRNEL